ncbi:uncharacterized protein LOC129962771 [Argiope bruennichi]|uniref:uncharacterized protein LOC129962771 n=1 Tax=Argiope bruennichi TaxID=94029 RepID=UPI002494BE83|nr:uncharacterized protein LOC129962771 [Argiope bruennichi]
MNWCEDNGVNRLNWAAQSPDLNPIENLWDELDRRIKRCDNRPKSVKERTCLLHAGWEKIPLSVIQTFVESMPRRVKAGTIKGRQSQAAVNKKPRTEENFKISTENSYSHLQEESDRPPKSIAPISLVIQENFNQILQEIMRKHPETENHFQRGFIQIKPKTEESRREIISLLQSKKQDFIINEAPEERPIKIVIRGLPNYTTIDDIKNELEANNYQIQRINQMKNFRSKTLLPLFLVKVRKTGNYKNIFNLKHLCFLSVKLEPYRTKNTATICYNCSGFHHSARNCRIKPRCIKCNGNHPTRDCQIKEKIGNPVCINCNATGHLAAWKGCPAIPRAQTQTANYPRRSYAEVINKSNSQIINPTRS